MSVFGKALQGVSQRWPLITLFLLVAITILSLIPLVELPPLPGQDKTHHLIAYSALMFPAFLANAKWRYRLFVLFALWSGAIELIQPLVNRYGEWLDMAANCTGLTAGAVLGWLLYRRN